MNFLQRLALGARVALGRDGWTAKASPYQWMIQQGDNRPMWSPDDYMAHVRRRWEINSLIYSAIMYKIRAVALTRMRAYTGKAESGTLLPSTDALAKLLGRPNPDMSWKEFEGLNTLYLNLSGNGFVFVERAGQTVTGLYPMRPDRVRIIPDSDGELRGYVYIPYGKAEADGLPILPDDMMHVKYPNAADDYEGIGYGLSPLRVLGQSADVDNDITRYLKIFFQQGAMPAGLLKSKLPIDERMADEMRSRWRERYGGAGNWSDVAVLGDEVEYQRISLSFAEMGFEVLDERNEARILGALGVPAILLDTRMSMKASTYANKAEARKAFWQDTFRYELALWDDEYSHALDSERAWVQRDLSGVPALAADVPALVKAAKDLWTMGVPVNQALRMVGLHVEAVEGGDVAYVGGAAAGSKPSDVPEPENDPPEEDMPDTPPEDEDAKALKAPAPACACGHERMDGGPAEAIEGAWSEDEKAMAWKAADGVALSHEDAFRVAAADAFRADLRGLLAIMGTAQEKALAQKATIQWLDLIPAVQDYLQAAAGANWRSTFIPSMEALVTDSGQRWAAQLGRAWDVVNVGGLEWFRGYSLTFAKPITQTTQDAIQGILAQAQLEGWSIYEMQTNMQKVFQQWIDGNVSPDDLAFLKERVTWWRAEMIARTETTRLQNAGSEALFREWGMRRKEWLASRDGRVRDTHAAAGGQQVGIDEPFMVGGYPMMYPGDSGGGAPPREFVNCRCAVLPLDEAGRKPR